MFERYDLRRVLLGSILIAIIVASRLLPHAYNLVPVGAIIMLSSIYQGKRFAWVVGIVGMLLGDLWLGFYQAEIMLSVYGSLLAITLASSYLRNNRSILSIASFALINGLIFFLVTNFAVWAFGDMYTKDLPGLGMAYYYALPFFRNTMIGNLGYSLIGYLALEHGYALVRSLAVSRVLR
ncbi:hypothetical protein KC853_00405 [Candidatus Saccharibacteria bacterium]|nr:hypothetical protein [Candidatus Saccharibacteria bacterium]MCB9834415.1 hypothetical protein [Candidatus Nomurabacteria bacterium]